MATIIDGLSLGSIYALIALGYTMVYGIAKMINFAHGDVIMVGAYSVFVSLSLGYNIYVATLFAVVICTILGIIIEKVAYKPLREASSLSVLITAIGVSYLLQSIAQLIFGARSHPVNIQFKRLSIAGVNINVSTIITLIAGGIIMILLSLFVKKTKTGRAMRAVAEDKGAARLMGINADKVITITFMIGSSLAAFASLFYLMQIPSTSPTLGSVPGIKAFTAAVIGGVGSISGAMAGGLILGVLEKLLLSVPVLSRYTTALEFSLLIVILLVKPTGLMGKKRREKV